VWQKPFYDLSYLLTDRSALRAPRRRGFPQGPRKKNLAEQFLKTNLPWGTVIKFSQRCRQLFVETRAVPSYQRRPSSPRKRAGNVWFPTNLHGVRRSARPTSVSTNGATHDRQDTVKTLRTIIWYKRACIRQTTRQPILAIQPLKKDVKKNVVIEQVLK